MRRRLRRRPAPRKALTPKTAIWKALGSSRLGGFVLSFCFRLVPHGKRYSSSFLQRLGGGGTLYPSSAPAGAPAAPGRSALSLLRGGERPGRHPDVASGGYSYPAPARLGASRGGAVSSVVTSGCPKRSEGGFPVGTRRSTAPHRSQIPNV